MLRVQKENFDFIHQNETKKVDMNNSVTKLWVRVSIRLQKCGLHYALLLI